MGCKRFSKNDRILKRPQYLAIKRGGRSEKSRHFVLNWQANGLAKSRLGMVVTKRVANAVGRNLLKRRLREIFRNNRASFPRGLDMVLVARPRASTLSFFQLEREVLDLLATAGAEQ